MHNFHKTLSHIAIKQLTKDNYQINDKKSATHDNDTFRCEINYLGSF